MKNDRLLKVSGCAMLLCGIADLIWLILQIAEKLTDRISRMMLLNGNIPLFFPLCAFLLILALVKLAAGATALGANAAKSRLPALLGPAAAALGIAGAVLSLYTSLPSKLLVVAGVAAAMLLTASMAERTRASHLRMGIGLLVCGAITAHFTLSYIRSISGYYSNMANLVPYYPDKSGSLRNMYFTTAFGIITLLITGITALCPFRRPAGAHIRRGFALLAVIANTANAVFARSNETIAIWFALGAAVSGVFFLTLFLKDTPTQQNPQLQ